ncbi:MAG: hypothetical protein RQ833_11575 [Sphingomonadaceae bacterium]|nr:hypothetical protein [Sphingomonadaceae bacterium]
MIMDIINRISAAISLAPLVRTATAVGVAVDMQGNAAGGLLIYGGVGGITFDANNRIDHVLEYSQDGSTWTQVSRGDVYRQGEKDPFAITNGVIESYSAARAAAGFTAYHFNRLARYWRHTATYVGTHGTGTLVQSIIVRGSKHRLSQ